jgi:hypothetical protein
MRSPYTSTSALQFAVASLLAIITTSVFTGCGSAAFSNPATVKGPTGSIVPTASMLVETPSVPPVLLFNGTGTISSDVAAVEAVLNTLKLSYATANTSEIEAMTESKLRSYKLLIVPGGNSITIGQHLTKAATANIHNAVQAGLHYLGICAGGFFGGYSIYNGLNLTSGVWFNVYKNGGKGTGKTAVEISTVKQGQLDNFWEDGPEFSGWGTIVDRYPDGTPSVVEGKSGSGWVILCGFHPEAPQSWRYGMKFTTSVAVDNAYAGTLIMAALNGVSLPHY